MTNIQIEAIGLVAAFFTTFAGIPQIVKIYKLKEARDISIYTYLMVTFGIILWLIYGLQINDTPLIYANAISLTLNLMIISLKLRYDRNIK